MCAQRLISYAAGTAPEFGPVETAKAAAEAGWPACGIWFEADDWTAQTTKQVRAVFDDTGMVPLDIEVVWIMPGPENPDHKRLIEAGAEIGARNVLMVSSDPDMAATTARFADLSLFALEHGVKPSLEFLPITEVKNISQAVEIISDISDAGILLDLLHLIRSGGSVADIKPLSAHQMHYAQLCDGVAMLDPHTPETVLADAIDGRSLPGEGALPCRTFMQALPPDLPISLEIRSKALRETYTDPIARAAATLKATQEFLAGIDEEI